MADKEAYTELLYRHELLRARLEIREHYLKTIVKEVYENIGQVLSLVRVQLTMLDPAAGDAGREQIDSSGKLVGSAIRDLRSLCQRFQPEAAISGTVRFNEAMEKEIKSKYPDAAYIVQVSGPQPSIDNGKELILFNLLIGILNLLEEDQERKLVSTTAGYQPATAEFALYYTGAAVKPARFRQGGGPFHLSVAERAKLLGGSVQAKSERNGRKIIKLVIPID